MKKDEESGIINGHTDTTSQTTLPPAKKIELHPAFFVSYSAFYN
jgi:hypothetical protein